MEHLNLRAYCAQFLEDDRLGDLPFFKEEDYTSNYRDLIELSLSLADSLKDEDHYYALKIDSPYFFFAHLLASIFAKKDVVVLSSKEPDNALLDYQKVLGFKRVITGVIGSGKKDTSFPDLEIPESAMAFSILSSGSSGPSKAIFLSLKNVYSSASSVIDFFKMNKFDTTFMNLPHHHIGGMMILWRAFFSMGSLTNVRENDFQFISLVPLQFKRALTEPQELSNLKKCRGILIGGAPLSEELKLEAKKENLPVFETYGMSETSSLVMLNGTPLKGQTVKLDENGYFLIKGPTLSPGAPVDDEGFFHTKDIGTQNSDGTFSFSHRGDILFKSGGELINPIEVEMKVKELPWIAEAVSVGVNHHEWTKALALVFKSTDPDKTIDDIKAHLKKELHPYLIPRYFYPAGKDLVKEGMKPKRFEVANFAREEFFKNLLHYLYIPHPDAKRLVVFFHGFMEDHTDMIPLMDSHHQCAYLFIDFPGHGKSRAGAFKKREDVFYYLSELILFKAQGLPYTLYGYSMGGRVALELALDYLRPEQLILESSHFGFKTAEEKRMRLESDRMLFKDVKDESDLKVFFESWYKNPIFTGYNQTSHYPIDLEKKLAHSPKEWQASMEFNSPGSSPYFYQEVMAKLSLLKVVGIIGSLDGKYKAHFNEVKNQLADFHLYEIESAGHNPHKTHLSDIKTILRNFI
nr:alpha/beta fold hydrolase [Bacteriovorax sp. HI3]